MKKSRKKVSCFIWTATNWNWKWNFGFPPYYAPRLSYVKYRIRLKASFFVFFFQFFSPFPPLSLTHAYAHAHRRALKWYLNGTKDIYFHCEANENFNLFWKKVELFVGCNFIWHWILGYVMQVLLIRYNVCNVSYSVSVHISKSFSVTFNLHHKRSKESNRNTW